MLSERKFAYTEAQELPHEREYVFQNELTGEELTLQKDSLEYHLTRPMRKDELT